MGGGHAMKNTRRGLLILLALFTVAALTTASASAQPKPNIVVIMGDDIGIWNIGAYHRGMMAGRTPNLDKIAAEGMLFTDYYAEASCTAGRAAFVTGELPIRTGMTTVGDRKSTRLNSSHRCISYAVFCLKKKKNKKNN